MALSQSQAHVIDFAPALPAERATEQKRWPAAPDMMKSAMVQGRPFQHDAGLSARVSGSTPTSTWGVGQFAPRRRRWRDRIVHRTAARNHARAGSRKAALIDSCVKYLGAAAARPFDYVDRSWMLEPLGTGLLAQCGAALRPTIGRTKGPASTPRPCGTAKGMVPCVPVTTPRCARCDRYSSTRAAPKTRGQIRLASSRYTARSGSIKPLRSAPR